MASKISIQCMSTVLFGRNLPRNPFLLFLFPAVKVKTEIPLLWPSYLQHYFILESELNICLLEGSHEICLGPRHLTESTVRVGPFPECVVFSKLQAQKSAVHAREEGNASLEGTSVNAALVSLLHVYAVGSCQLCVTVPFPYLCLPCLSVFRNSSFRLLCLLLQSRN